MSVLLEQTRNAGSSCWLVITREKDPDVVEKGVEESKEAALTTVPEELREVVIEERKEEIILQRTEEDNKIEPGVNETRPRELEEIGLLVYTRNLSEP